MTNDSAYLYDNDAPVAERRLRGLEAIEDASTIRLLTELGVTSGWHCLEIGAGAGSIARWLAGTVGRSGRVVATDIDPRLLDPAAYEVWQHDILRDALPHAVFDLVHFRHLLIHAGSTMHATVLRSISHALRSEGVLLAEESDLGDWRVDPDTPEPVRKLFTEGVQIMLNVYRSRGMDPSLGAALAVSIERAGFKLIRSVRRTRRVTGGSAEAQFQQSSAKQLAESIRGSRPTDAALLDRFAECFTDRNLKYRSRATVSVSGAKPADAG